MQIWHLIIVFGGCSHNQEGISVQYPGLKSHPHHERFNQLCNPGAYGYGGMCALLFTIIYDYVVLLSKCGLIRFRSIHGF